MTEEQNISPTSKSSNAFRTISEVSNDIDVPQHTLRFWESKFPQIMPMKRGGGRRYYRPQEVDFLIRIKFFLQVKGFSIKSLQKLLKESRKEFDEIDITSEDQSSFLNQSQSSEAKRQSDDFEQPKTIKVKTIASDSDIFPEKESSAQNSVPESLEQESKSSQPTLIKNRVRPEIEIPSLFDFMEESFVQIDVNLLKTIREELVALQDFITSSIAHL